MSPAHNAGTAAPERPPLGDMMVEIYLLDDEAP
jgi:hypothetical protein